LSRGSEPSAAVSFRQKEQTPLPVRSVSARSTAIFNATTTMNTKDLIRLGVPVGEPIQLAYEFIQNFIPQGYDGAQLEAENSTSSPIRHRSSQRRTAGAAGSREAWGYSGVGEQRSSYGTRSINVPLLPRPWSIVGTQSHKSSICSPTVDGGVLVSRGSAISA
jgi:hypothetical protein